MKKNVVIAAGGTGGHISPGIALAEAIHKQKNKLFIESVFIHTLNKNKDNPDFKNTNCDILYHNTPSISHEKLFFPFLFILDLFQTIFYFIKLKINVVIAMGGYSSLPAILYAILFCKELYLCEQNCIPGKVNRIFFRFSKKIAFSFPPSIPSKNLSYKVIGNPVREKVVPSVNYNFEQKLHTKKMNILAMGGSQGARQINNMISKLLEDDDLLEYYNVRIISGANLYNETKEAVGKKEVEVLAYSDDMKAQFEWAHIVVARSGAGVLAECALYGLFLILVPYPFAADNHQEANAKYFENLGVKVLYQKDEDIQQLKQIFLHLKSNKQELLTVSKNLGTIANPKAAEETIHYFFK